MIVIPVVGYTKPPLRMNDRMNWRPKWRIKSDLRRAGQVMGAQAIREGGSFPLCGIVDVVLVWYVPNRHRRDASGPQETLKPLEDGLVDAGVLTDDSARYVRRSYCEIRHDPGKPERMEIHIMEATDGT